MSKVTIFENTCKGCGLCVTVCPKKILYMDVSSINSKGYNPARVSDPEKCLSCAMCALMCPDCAIKVEK